MGSMNDKIRMENKIRLNLLNWLEKASPRSRVSMLQELLQAAIEEAESANTKAMVEIVASDLSGKDVPSEESSQKEGTLEEAASVG